MTRLATTLLLLSAITASTLAFTAPRRIVSSYTTSNVILDMATRREMICAIALTTPFLVASTAAAAEGAVFKAGQTLSPEAAKDRFILARTDVTYLLDNYATISKGGGDAVRRYLGTVGVSSGMYGIPKVLKQLQEEADDIVEYTETMDEFNAYLYQAEGAAYQSLFVEHSSAKGSPESLLATAKEDVVQMSKYMDLLAKQLSL